MTLHLRALRAAWASPAALLLTGALVGLPLAGCDDDPPADPDAGMVPTDAGPSCAAQNGGCDELVTCTDTPSGPECGDCPPGFSGTGETGCAVINDCEGMPCMNGGTCFDGTETYTCTCAAGFVGLNCETNVDDCDPNPCENGGSCEDGVNNYTCTCLEGYNGRDCEIDIDDCEGAPCLNGGTCTDGVASYSCECADGYEGDDCETDIDECDPNPCMNGGTCTDEVATYTCDCPDGWRGQDCEIVALVWTPARSGFSDDHYGIYAASATNVFVTGRQGRLGRYDGTSWTSAQVGGTDTWNDVWGTSAAAVWAVGYNDKVTRWLGVSWSPVFSGGTVGAHWFGVHGLAPTTVHIVGERDGAGLISRSTDGASFTAQAVPAGTPPLWDVFAVDATHVWAVGNDGTILFHDGSTWTASASGTTEHLRGVWGAAADDVWVSGFAGTILHWDGTEWTAVTSGVTADLRRMWGASADRIWVVGTSGTVLAYDGAAWGAEISGTTDGLEAVWGTDASHVWAAGFDNRFLVGAAP